MRLAYPKKKVIAYIQADHVELRGKRGQPLFLARLKRPEGESLLRHLSDLGETQTRRWGFLTSSTPDPKRLRLLEENQPPAYELEAAPNYLRGDIFRVTGDDSCNIHFSIPTGAALLAKELGSALERSKDSIDIVVPNRHQKRDLVEFIADTDSQAPTSQEHERLAIAGEVIAAQTLAAEDFSDWE